MALKYPIMADGCVINRFKMLAYYRVSSAFKSIYALPSTMLDRFKAIFYFNIKGCR